MNFYDKFAWLCANKGVAPSTACTQMGFSASAVQRWHNTMPTQKTLFRMAEYFGYSAKDFLEYSYGESVECKFPQKASKQITGVSELNTMVSIATILDDPVFAKYLQIVSNSTPEQREYLDKVMKELRNAALDCGE